MIPYLLWFIVIIAILLLGSSTEAEVGSVLLSCAFFSLPFIIYLLSNGFTEAEREISRVEDNKIEVVSKTPTITKHLLGDGCTMYYYYGNGIGKHQTTPYTTKFVRCENSKVDTERTWSCGTSKSPKTCSETITTIESNK